MEGLLQRGRRRGPETTVSQCVYSHTPVTLCLCVHITCVFMCGVCGCRHLSELEEEEAMAQELLLERSLLDPTMRDRLPIVTRSLAHKKEVKTSV